MVRSGGAKRLLEAKERKAEVMSEPAYRELPLHQRAKFLSMLRASSKREDPAVLAKRPGGTDAPLSYAQRTLWFVEQATPGTPTYHLPMAVRLRGYLDTGALERALVALVQRHEALRTSLFADGEPRQVVAADVPVALPVTAAADWPDAVRHASELARTPFPLLRSPLWRAGLFRIGPDDHLFTTVVHHLMFDGVSADVFYRDLAELYRAERDGDWPDLPDLEVQYPDFACWQQARLDEDAVSRLGAYWRDQLARLQTLDLPTDRPRPGEPTLRGGVAVGRLEADVCSAVQAFARKTGTTSYTVLLAALWVLLARYSGQTDIVVGSPSSGRIREQLDNVLGFFVNMLVLRGDLSGDPGFTELVSRARKTLNEAAAHAELPFEQIVQAVRPKRRLNRPPLFQVAFAAMGDSSPPAFDGLETKVVQQAPDTSRFDLSWAIAGTAVADVVAEYSTDLWDGETIRTMIRHYGELLRSLLSHPDAPCLSAAMLPDADRAHITASWQAPRRLLPEQAVPQLLSDWAERGGAAAAVRERGRVLSYKDLDEHAGAVAAALAEHTAKPGDRVAIRVADPASALCAVLGVWRAGAAAMILDPAQPDSSAGPPPGLNLTQQHAVAIIADQPLPGDPPAVDPALALVAEPLTDDVLAQPDDPAWSHAGGPALTHRAVLALAMQWIETFALTPADDVLIGDQPDPTALSMAIATLWTGGRLHVTHDVRTVADVASPDQISVACLPGPASADLPAGHLPRLRAVLLTGDPWLVRPPGLAADVTVVNAHTPDGCAGPVLAAPIGADGPGDGPGGPDPVLGLPIAGHVAHVSENSLVPAPLLVAGELLVAGPCVPGWPAAPAAPAQFARLSGTGELVRRRTTGELVFLGRAARAARIDGERVNLDGVEAALLRLPRVTDAAAGVIRGPDDRDRLACWICGSGVDVPGAGQSLAQLLPAEHVPADLTLVAVIPRDQAGIPDLAALPVEAHEEDVVAARNETERLLAEQVFAPALGIPALSVTADFFQLGGSSLQATQVIAAASRQFDVDITVADFFRAPTVAGLSVVVDRRRLSTMPESELVEALMMMNDAEVERLAGSDWQPAIAGLSAAGRVDQDQMSDDVT